MRPDEFDRCLTMAACSAYIALYRYLDKHPTVQVAEAIKAVQEVNADDCGLDYRGGYAIYNLIKPGLNLVNFTDDLRSVVFKLLEAHHPWWLELAPYGRDKIRAVLGADQLQCLKAVGLFDPEPDPNVLLWWDELSAIARGIAETERMRRARDAERLSLNRERERLKKLGITQEPEWVSLEDNTIGYDIRSYDILNGKIVNRLIEVKSTLSNVIFVSRNEWDNAIGAEDHYYFHVWKLPNEEFAEYPVASFKLNVPLDRGAGRWDNVRIEMSELITKGSLS